MSYLSTFISSEHEENKRRALLNGARLFSLGGKEFYFAYNPSLMVLKEGINKNLYEIEKILNRLGPSIKKEYEHSCLLEEVKASCALDGYPFLRRLEGLYLTNKPLVAENRVTPIKNLSLKAGFSVSSPFKNKEDIEAGMSSLKELSEKLLKEDVLIGTLIEHFAFEYVHPYQKMNGLIGRHLVYQNLKDSIYEFLGARFSCSFIDDKKKYFIAFKRSEFSFDLNEYLELICESLLNELNKIREDLEAKEKRWNTCLDRLHKLHLRRGQFETLKGLLMMKVFKKQKLNLTRLAKVLNKSERTVFRHMSMFKPLILGSLDTPK